MLSRYAAAVVRRVRKHPQELGCIREDELLGGELDYQCDERAALAGKGHFLSELVR